MIDRRQFAWAVGGAAIGLGLLPSPAYSGTKADISSEYGGDALARDVRAIEQASGGRLGVVLVDTRTGARFAWRGDERFPMCSTFKFLLAGAVLARIDAGRLNLARTVQVRRDMLVPNSPVIATHAGGSVAVETMLDAALTRSDNTAANLLLPLVGGPAGVTAFVRTLGDRTTQLDREEPGLNEATPGDPRDTTSPRAMTGNLHALLLGPHLSAASRHRLTDWMIASRTGGRRLRAGLPAGWRIGDKTGTGARGSTNDIAILWPPAAPPLLVAVYLTGSAADEDHRAATIAAVGRAVARAHG